MQDQAFSYSTTPAAPPVESAGFFTDWFFNMFAAAIDLQLHSPTLTLVYLAMICALIFLRLFTGPPVTTLGCAAIYIYTTIHTYNLFTDSPYILDNTPAGWKVTAKGVWFAGLFTLIWMWGVSRALQAAFQAVLSTGIGAILAPLNPLRLLNKFRSSDAELDDMEGGGSAKDPKRQMTAIMMTDIVGYSKQMGANEAAMYKKLEIHNEIMRGQIVRNRGTVIKTIGDAFMVRFRSAENAVQCALDCQKAIADYNKSKPAEDQFHIRIGVHMGEVIHTGSDVFGEGVNIAARIEPQCDPDGVTVSDVVANAARNKVPAHFMSIGRKPMKNIANPPELFKVYAIEQEASQKVQKTAAAPAPAAKGGKAAPAPAGASQAGTPGGVFKL